MTLLTKDELEKLIMTYPESADLTRERKELLVAFLESFSHAELDEFVRSEEMPAEEMAFCRACLGLQTADRTVTAMLPTETLLRLL